jgi:hypothetical protein
MERALGIGFRVITSSQEQEYLPEFLGLGKPFCRREGAPVAEFFFVHIGIKVLNRGVDIKQCTG